MLDINTRRVGVFIDVQNMYYSARNLFNKKVNFENIVSNAVGDQKLVRAVAYTISTPSKEESPFFEALRGKGIEVKSKELLDYGTSKKGDWDVGITVDIIRMLDMLDVVVLVSGDGDFTPLADFIRSRGRIFHVVSFRESTSGTLVGATDVYTNLSDDKKKYLIAERRAGRGSSEKVVQAKKVKQEDVDDIEESRTRRLSF
ncbi:MAG: NYN domain-containing protein [bacterium]